MSLSNIHSEAPTLDCKGAAGSVAQQSSGLPHWVCTPERFHALRQIASETLAAVSASGLVLDFKPAGDVSLKVSCDKVVGRSLSELLPGRFSRECMELIRKALETRQLQTAVFEIPLDSVVRELEVRLAASGEGEVLACVRDLTDHRLHDSLGQHLTGISFLSKALHNRLAERGLTEADQAQEIALLVVQTLAHTRNIARGLIPLELEQSGRLIHALSELVSNTEKLFRVVCRLEMDPSADFTDTRVSTELFRITQEAISNAVRHGKARKVVVRVDRNGKNATLLIQDDGAGLPVQRKGDGLGLRIMNFRAHRIGGRVEITPCETGGTRVCCEFPFPSDTKNPGNICPTLPQAAA
jgi:signal transduction histidine kinase